MAPARSPAGRLLLLFAGVVAIALVLWWPTPPTPSGDAKQNSALVRAPEAAAITDHQPAAVLPAIERSEVPPEALPAIVGLDDPAQQVAVRFWITTNGDEEPGHAPPDAAGWTAVAQTWIDATGETHRHEMPFNRHGMAAFVFDGPTHVDWFGAIPPTGSAYGFDDYEGHDDYDIGSQEDLFLQVGFGGMLQGKVVDTSGRPVAGAPVELMHDSGAALDFTPGFQQTHTAADGSFSFGRLAAERDWSVAVTPGDWLMVDPSFGDVDYGKGVATVMADPLPADAGTLIVMPGATVDMWVVDSQGTGVPAVFLDLEVLHYFGAQMRKPETIEARPLSMDLLRPPEMQAFLEGRDPSEISTPRVTEIPQSGLEDPYQGDYDFVTDSQGHAQLHLVPGRYRLELTDYPGIEVGEGGEIQSIVREFTTGEQQIQVRLPSTLGGIRGLLLDEQEQALAGATLLLSSDYLDRTLITDGSGHFQAVQLPIDADYQLEVEYLGDDSQLVAHSWSPRPQLAAPMETYQVQRGLRLDLKIMQAEAMPLPEARLQLVSWSANADTPAIVNADWWERVSHFVETNRNGYAGFNGLLPGTVTVALLLPQASVDQQGRSTSSLLEYQRWQVEIKGSLQVLTADLGGYHTPPSQRTQHRIHLLDAVTGKEVGPATLHLKPLSARATHATTSRSSWFNMTVARGPVHATIHAHGYRTYETTWEQREEESVEHLVRLQPEDSRLFLDLRDSQGEALPNCTVAFYGPDGGRIKVDVQPRNRYVRLANSAYLSEGKLELGSVPAGKLLLRPSIFGYSGATATVEIPEAPGGRHIKVFLDHSLEELRQAVRDMEEEQ